VVVVPREAVVELPLTVEEAMRLLVSGGVITPDTRPGQPGGPAVVIRPAPGAASGAAGGAAPELLTGPGSVAAGAGLVVDQPPRGATLVNE
jgi:hypothetical protein